MNSDNGKNQTLDLLVWSLELWALTKSQPYTIKEEPFLDGNYAVWKKAKNKSQKLLLTD